MGPLVKNTGHVNNMRKKGRTIAGYTKPPGLTEYRDLRQRKGAQGGIGYAGTGPQSRDPGRMGRDHGYGRSYYDATGSIVAELDCPDRV